VRRTASKDNPEALQGFHAEHLLFLIDEASGIDGIVFEVGMGALSTPGREGRHGWQPNTAEGLVEVNGQIDGELHCTSLR
jgi:hypothetical protein